MRLSTEIKKRVSCQDVCREYGIDVNRAGFTRCLWHNEKTASLKIYPGDRGYHCFGCGQSGSCIDLVMKLFDVSVGDACKRLNDDFRLDLMREDNLSRDAQIERNRRAWERRRQEAELEKERTKLVNEFHEAVEDLRLIEFAFWAAAPKDPEEEWSECFVTAASRRDRARARVDDALEALFEFDEKKRAS